MSEDNISAQDNHSRQSVSVLDTEMTYVDTGKGDPVVFLHGNPTSSYLWRNVIPHVEPLARCLAPDLIGMGGSGPSPNGSYAFVDHARYLDAWFDAMNLTRKVTFVIHDWGCALGFHWARRHPDRVKALVYMEGIVRPVKWDEWPEAAHEIFEGMRSPAGEEIILEKNVFIEAILPGSILRSLTDEEMNVYRKPFVETGERRRPMLTWPRQVPIDGQPADVAEIVDTNSKWLAGCDLPKLFINADPGAILTGPQREFCRAFPNQKEITVKGIHFIQEDSPHDIGQAIAEFLNDL